VFLLRTGGSSDLSFGARNDFAGQGTFCRCGRKAGSAGCALRRVLSLVCFLLTGLSASHAARAQDHAAQTWLGLIAGPPAASETVLAADMASLFANSADLRVVPMLGDNGAGNLALLLDHPSIDLAFVATDVLAEQAARQKSLTDRLELVARLSPQEVHLLARSDIGAASELSGKPVGFGPVGSASAAAAATLFKTLGIKVEVVHLDATAAIEQLKHGTISAAVIVGGRPAPLVAAIPITAGIHLLPISFSAPLDAAYLPARLESADYPNLIRAGSDVATIATGIVLLAARTKADPGAQRRLDRFVAALFPRFGELRAEGRHPKWREVNLAASLPGLLRARAAEAWLATAPEEKPKPMATSLAGGQVPAQPKVMSKEQREALFRRFIEWQRDKQR
jgi:TRAP transporter TAXI family solute receptor